MFQCVTAALQDNHSGVARPNGSTFFLHATAGTGKTFIARALLASVRSQHGVAFAVASSGVAASLLPGGMTAHRAFGIPVPVMPASTSTIAVESSRAEVLRQAQLIVWDEGPMCSKDAFDCVHRFLCDLHRLQSDSAPPNAGVAFVIMGDFRQVLPVVPRGSRVDVVSSTLMRSSYWQRVKVLELTTNERVRQRLLAGGWRRCSCGSRVGRLLASCWEWYGAESSHSRLSERPHPTSQTMCCAVEAK